MASKFYIFRLKVFIRKTPCNHAITRSLILMILFTLPPRSRRPERRPWQKMSLHPD